MKCIDEQETQDSLRSYSAYLLVPTLTTAIAKQLESAAQAVGLEIEVGNGAIEFEYQGRDSNRFIVEFLKTMATAVGTATGEIRCEITGDDCDPYFEFFKIRNSKLVGQRGTIVRQPEFDIQ